MNIIKAYIMKELRSLLDSCESRYLNKNGITDMVYIRGGYLDIGYALQLLYNNIVNLSFEEESHDNMELNKVQFWSKKLKVLDKIKGDDNKE